MKEQITVKVNTERFGLEEFTTDSIFKTTAWLIALAGGFENGVAQEIAELCFMIWLDIDARDISEFMIIDYITDNYDDLPEDYKKIKEEILEYYVWGH